MKSVSTRTKRGSVAMSPEYVRGEAIMALFQQYRSFPEFTSDLLRLADSNVSNASGLLVLEGHSFETVETRSRDDHSLSPYVDAVVSFAMKWGLDRLPTLSGYEAIHRWIFLRYATDEEKGESFGFGLSYEGDGFISDLAVVDGVEWDPEEEPRVDSEIQIPIRNRTTDQIKAWRINTGARTRILRKNPSLSIKAVSAGLDRIQAEHMEAGYVWSDSQPQFRRNVTWVFQRLALRMPVYQISESADVSYDRVYRTLQELRERMDISEFPDVPRKPKRDARSNR